MLKIGDFIVFFSPPGTRHSNNTGHIMMINHLPKLIAKNSTNTVFKWQIQIMIKQQVHMDQPIPDNIMVN